VPGQDDRLVQEPGELAFAPPFVARVVKRARSTGSAVLQVHTHPFTDSPEFSPIDDAGEQHTIPFVYSRVPRGPHGTIVLGKTGYAGRLYRADGKFVPIDRLMQLDSSYTHIYLHGVADTRSMEQFDRNVRAIGRQGQAILATLRVGVVGVGGIGSIVAQQLTHLGIGSLLLIDDDVIDQTNLNRVVGATLGDVGRPKVAVMKASVSQMGAGTTKVSTECGSVLDEDVARRLLATDFVFICTDNHASRAVLNQMAHQYRVPMIDIGVQIDAESGRLRAITGRVQMLAPGLACLLCSGVLDSSQIRVELMTPDQRKADPYVVGEPVPQPAVISINGTVASLAVTMFLSATVGFPSDARRLIYRATDSALRRLPTEPAPGCIICSDQGAAGRGDNADWQLVWRARR